MTSSVQHRSALRKLWSMKWTDRLLLAESFALLAVSSLLIAVLPFRWVGRLAEWRKAKVLPEPQRSTAIQRVRWAVLACARRVPWKAVCFQQGLAAQLMLHRRGIPSVLYYGAKQDRVRGLEAHVWIRDGDLDVIGGDVAGQFAVLATFPAPPRT